MSFVLLIVKHCKINLKSGYNKLYPHTHTSHSYELVCDFSSGEKLQTNCLFAIFANRPIRLQVGCTVHTLLLGEAHFFHHSEFKFMKYDKSDKTDSVILAVEIPNGFYCDEGSLTRRLIVKSKIELNEVSCLVPDKRFNNISDDEFFISAALLMAHCLPVVMGKIDEREDWLFEKVKKIISTNIENSDLYLVEVAELCFCSKRTIQNVLRRNGETFASLVNRLRVERFEYLLINSDFSVLNISQRCGINSSSYAIKLFKRQKGLTPKQFRERMRSQGNKGKLI